LLRGPQEAFENMPPDINEADWKVLRHGQQTRDAVHMLIGAG